MKKRRVTIDSDAKEDLRALHRWIVMQGAPQAATNYVLRIRAFIKSLDLAAERGTTLEEIDEGLRSIPFESVIVAIRVRANEVVVARIFHSSQNWLKILKDHGRSR